MEFSALLAGIPKHSRHYAHLTSELPNILKEAVMELFHRILVPLDGSTKSERAIPTAIKLAQNLGSQITLLRVVEIPRPSIENPPEPMKEWIEEAIRREIEAAEAYLEGLASLFKANGIAVRTIVRSKTPEQDVLDVVDTDHIDLILMSPHGRGYQDFGHECLSFGSVADKVLRRSPVPVLLVRGDEHRIPGMDGVNRPDESK
jgi:nucleotide-binding universal stress UspA family protein